MTQPNDHNNSTTNTNTSIDQSATSSLHHGNAVKPIQQQDNLSSHDNPSTSGSLNPTSNPTHKSQTTLRSIAGTTLHTISNTINDNIILARYGTIATCTGLVMYGLWKTPLFFRFKHVSDIPSIYFTQRKVLHGRLIHVVPSSTTTTTRYTTYSTSTMTEFDGSSCEQPIRCLVRHLSPMGRLFFTRSSFEYAVRANPSSRLFQSKVGSKLDGSTMMNDQSHIIPPLEDANDLLEVEVAGIKTLQGCDALDAMTRRQSMEFLQNLAANRTPISFVPISRRVYATDDEERPQTAICQLQYRSKPWNIFSSDLASRLVCDGSVGVSSATMHFSHNNGKHDRASTTIVDASQDLKTVRSDIRYLESLRKTETQAIQKRKGLWSNQHIRKNYLELVNEADLEMSGGIIRKIWMKIQSFW